ncbi:MAG: site-2 protease family protein, partial [Thermoleophilia bacterium]
MSGGIDSGFILQFILTLPALLVSMVFHEVSHGYVAYRLGDDTAMRQGRLSLNPIRHLDPLGSLMLFMTFFSSGGRMLFGWAKPVPIDPRRFSDPRRGMMWVGIAGPASNLLLALACSTLLRYWEPSSELVALSILRVFQLNIILMMFNLMPIPPLDGSRIVGGFLTPRAYMKWMQLDQYGPVFIIILLVMLWGPFGNFFYGALREL